MDRRSRNQKQMVMTTVFGTVGESDKVFELVMPDGERRSVEVVRRDGRALGVRFVEAR